ncbi:MULTISPECIES: YodC family protein [Morganellaceae]|uniref:YodC family protein n=1 Tax=Morganellaceae TaxID=1903414 RepID=UPI001599ACA2|nr:MULTISPECIES: DUF2158 domain-containing protein [Morganellaceae]ELB1227866.1 DUF2158 domain-containing protein [Proteus mirabilis]QKJ48142.1 DUF2158 domain-containing protein [Proteus vulgaris]MCG9537133.1 DUF2158 domain-containing protein [Providencia huaxiensis]QKJ48158.1 DUF2158 domain-containing protein [Proteus vulgaris]UDN37847.1 DUF2158 domain-containing protein [Proteus sp. NMG38-2]
MSEKFNSGDVVRLKSGSPKMTVDGYSNLGDVICVWYDSKKNDYPKKTFSEDALELYKSEDEIDGLGVSNI